MQEFGMPYTTGICLNGYLIKLQLHGQNIDVINFIIVIRRVGKQDLLRSCFCEIDKGKTV